MASIGQADLHMNGISRLQASMHPAAFSNAWASDYRERYMVDGSSSPYHHHGRSTFNRNGLPTTSSGGYQHSCHSTPGPVESSPSVWQQRQASGSDIIMPHHHHGHSAENSMRGGGGSSRVTAMLGSPESMSRGSPASLQSSSSELYDSSGGTPATTTTTVGGDWQQFVDSGVRYSSLLAPASSCGSPLQQHSSSTGGNGNNEGAMIRELIGRLGGASMVSSCDAGSLASTSPLSSQRAGVLKNGGGNHNSWNSASPAAAAVEIASNVGGGLTVDPSKGGLSMNGLTTSHCLSPFSGDPGFAERAARFSSFGNGNYAAQPFLSTSTECGVVAASRMRSRSLSAVAAPLSDSSTKQQRETAVVLNDTPPELREVHSVRVVSEDLLASADLDQDDNDDDDEGDNSPERNYGLVNGKPAVKLLSRTASNLLVAGKLVDEQREDAEEEEAGGGTTTTASADASSNPCSRIRGISSSSLEQTGAAGTREACPSPAVSSGATDVSAKKRKTSALEERRTPNMDVGSAVSSHGERDAKITEAEDTKAKRFRRGDGGSKEKDEMRSKAERSSSETSEDTSPRSMKAHSKPSEPPSKPDYIHVRARRGQATDSHSLAERVRREKISERMKFLQDLVPGCSKVTGKAVMLDEIINYVQSLQRQVEFLSMKLASVNPQLDFNLESFLGKEGPHPGSQAVVMGSENGNSYPPMHPHLLQHQAQLQQGLDYQQLHSEATLRRSLSVPGPAVIPRVDGFVDGVCQTGWDDGELQSIVQMGIGHVPSMSSPALHCHLPPGQVKVELQQSPISCL